MSDPPAAWPRCRGWIEKALLEAGGTHDIGDVEAMLGRHEAWLVPGERSAIVFKLIAFPRLRLLHVWLAGGDTHDAIAELLDLADGLLTEAARRFGCDALTLEGRPGWKRALAPFGWEAVGVSLAKRIDGTHELPEGQGRVEGDTDDQPRRHGDASGELRPG